MEGRRGLMIEEEYVVRRMFDNYKNKDNDKNQAS